MRAARSEVFASGMVALALATAGCDWRNFDSLKETTPVAAITAPSGYGPSDDFGPVLVALPAPTDGSAAGRFIAAATLATGVGVISYDPAGRPHGVGVSNGGLDALQGGPVRSLALLPSGREALLGAPNASLGDLLVMSVDPPHATRMFIGTVGDPWYGVGVGAGNLAAGADPEIVVLSENALRVYIDSLPTMERKYSVPVGTADPCPINSMRLPDDDLLNRSVIVASLIGSGMQIAVGAPSFSGDGHVSIFNFDATAGVTCAFSLTGAEAHFGRSMTLVDLDGDATPDHLLVGAPQTRAYLYSLPLAPGATPVAMATDTQSDGNFGFSVAAFDIDGKPGDEMFIGSPDATVDGATTAGRVSVYTGASMTLLPSTTSFPNPLSEHEPGAGHGYGMAIMGVPFCPGSGAGGGAGACTKLLHVGSRSKVFAYYALRPPDVRKR